ncbi:hypothetical protein KAR91_74305 [Candidatus Pacearchaeota archaeon]|nr:hypothetical protein [Candidatus Pacearchaeota archaeon]
MGISVEKKEIKDKDEKVVDIVAVITKTTEKVEIEEISKTKLLKDKEKLINQRLPLDQKIAEIDNILEALNE